MNQGIVLAMVAALGAGIAAQAAENAPAAGPVLRVTVLDGKGKPVPGARVAYGTHAAGAADGQGVFSGTVAPGGTVEVAVNGKIVSRLDIPAAGKTGEVLLAEVVWEPGAAEGGRFLFEFMDKDQTKRFPAGAGQEFRIRVLSGRNAGAEGRLETDADGVIVLSRLALLEPGDSYTLTHVGTAQTWGPLPYDPEVPNSIAAWAGIILDIHFLVDSAVIDFKDRQTRTSLEELKRIARLYRNRTIEIVGHTDSDGSDEYNLKLSIDRANALRDYLLKNGFAAEQIRATGRGKREPAAPNTTRKGKLLNRRIQVDVL